MAGRIDLEIVRSSEEAGLDQIEGVLDDIVLRM
jgi:hypothetical protein